MKIIKYIFWILWKIWFYTLVLVVILILSPLLTLSLLSESTYKYFFSLARVWAYAIYYGTGFCIQRVNKYPFEKEKSYMLCANHTSMMDIMLMLILANTPFVFVGKAELAKLPIFGFFYKRACILVDRTSKLSRQQTIIEASKKLQKGLSICIFPEGGVPNDESIILDEFKDGAFRLAIDFQIPIASFTFIGLKKSFPFRFFAGFPTRIKVVQHPLVCTKEMTPNDKSILKEKVRNLIITPLIEG